MAELQPYFADIVPGDYNYDGPVDAADFTVWRDTAGQTGAGLDADANIDGIVDTEDYDTWKANFGAGSGAGGGNGAPVPEPGTSALAALAVLVGCGGRRRCSVAPG